MKDKMLLVVSRRDNAFEANLLSKYDLFVASPGQSLVGEEFGSTILFLSIYPDKQWFEEIVQIRMNRPRNVVNIHYFHLVDDLLAWLRLNR